MYRQLFALRSVEYERVAHRRSTEPAIIRSLISVRPADDQELVTVAHHICYRHVCTHAYTAELRHLPRVRTRAIRDLIVNEVLRLEIGENNFEIRIAVE